MIDDWNVLALGHPLSIFKLQWGAYYALWLNLSKLSLSSLIGPMNLHLKCFSLVRCPGGLPGRLSVWSCVEAGTMFLL